MKSLYQRMGRFDGKFWISYIAHRATLTSKWSAM